MSKIDTAAETESASGGIDRRAALKKVAVGGAVAWTAPTLLSSKVSAQTPGGFCTPKCYPVQAAPDVTGCTYCIGGPDQFRQAAGLTFSDGSGASCPCGGTPTVSVVTNNLAFRSLGGGGPTGPLFVGVISGEYLVVGSASGGVLSQGTYISVSGSLDVTTSCKDRDGDTITTECSYLLEFTFQPNSGACNQVSTVGCSADVSSISNVQFLLIACRVLCNGAPL